LFTSKRREAVLKSARLSRLWLAVLVLISVASPVSCSSNSAGTEIDTIGQKYLFEVSYINWAWGYVDQGMYVDGDGNVYSYDLSNRNPRFQYPEDGVYSQASLNDKYSSNLLFIRTVDGETLLQMSNLIDPASQGQLTDLESTACDAGGTAYTAFLFDEVTGEYTGVLLYQSGDWTVENTAPEAATLRDWLMQLWPA
jgi:hypothetical protein